MKKILFGLVGSFVVAAFICSGCPKGQTGSVQSEAPKYNYPESRKGTIVDDYHGTKVADPYRWLEDPASKETLAWTAMQNELTFKFIRGALQEKIKARLTKIWNYPRFSLPYKKGGRYFFSKNDGLQNQAVFYTQASLEAEPKVVIDPNKLSKDGTVALTGSYLSEDGQVLAMLLSSKGSDWQERKIRKVESGQDYAETLKWCKFTLVAWKHDGSGFFYDRFPDPASVAPEDRNNYSRVYWHTLNTEQDKDELVYENPENKELGFSPFITEDGKYLVLRVEHGTDPKNRIYYRATESKGPFIKLLDAADAMYSFVGNQGPVFYFHTDLDAPRGRIISIDLSNPDRKHWKEIIPKQSDVIKFATIVNDHLVVRYMHDAHDLLKIIDLTGKLVKEIELPGIGTVAGLSGKQKDTEMFFGFTSFLYPYTTFHYDFKTDQVKLFRGPKVDFDASGYETKQVFYKSKDGTRVPMFITHKKGLKLDGNNPTLLFGYGGFNVSLTPYFSISRLIWLENGGVFVLANLRGGNEYGEKWHQAGILGNKQNVFDDFIAAAEWLISNKYTSNKKLAIIGGSNGGLLTAACLLQRPELFGAVVSVVPVIDMLRYHKFSIGHYWVSDYGNAEKDPEHFKFLYAYSPLHNIKPAVAHPPTLITTADTDDRVVPMHGKKFAAALQAADEGRNPVLIRIETKAGHGRGKPTSKRIEEAADIYTFLFKIFGMQI
ncbi:MAG: S9 family peptidase [Deltaproteobacteria bacterium]|nr:S9 family peptidase [Deltaproteobacteria bacterium]